MNFLRYSLADSAQRENGHMVLWNLVFAPLVRDAMTEVKNRKETKKREESSALSIVKGVVGHLSMDVHMQDTQGHIKKDNNIPLTWTDSTNTHVH